MGHADAELFDAKTGGLLDEFHHHRDQAFASIQSKPLLAAISRVQKFFEDIGVDQVAQNPLPQLGVKRRLVLHRFHALLQPPSAFSILDVHVLGANGAAIRAFKVSDDVSQGGRAVEGQVTGVKGLIQVRFAQAEGLQFQGAGLGPFRSQRIQLGVQMSNVSVVVDQTVHSALRCVGSVGGVRSHGFGIGQRRGT